MDLDASALGASSFFDSSSPKRTNKRSAAAACGGENGSYRSDDGAILSPPSRSQVGVSYDSNSGRTKRACLRQRGEGEEKKFHEAQEQLQAELLRVREQVRRETTKNRSVDQWTANEDIDDNVSSIIFIGRLLRLLPLS